LIAASASIIPQRKRQPRAKLVPAAPRSGRALSESAKVRNPYFGELPMLAKITSKNQLTLPKSVTQAVGAAEYFDVEARAGQIILTPVRIQRGDAVRAKLAELDLTDADMMAAVAWARAPQPTLAHVAEPQVAYGPVTAKAQRAGSKKTKLGA
jgi:hypothetical protein